MPIVRSDILPLLEAGLRTDFLRAYQQMNEDSIAARIATVVQTTLPTQKYGWLGSVPLMREFEDERLPAGLRAYNYSISDTVWESSISVDRRALEDDQYDMIRLRVQDMAREAVRHREQTVVEKLIQGTINGVGYDGKLLFDTTHEEGDSGVQSNLMNGSLSSDNLQEATSSMMQVKNDRGVPMGIIPDTLLVGPKLKWIAMELLESAIVVKVDGVNQSTPYKNVLQGKLQLVVSPYITGSHQNKWFLLDTSRAMRAVILQERRDVPIEFAALDSPGSDNLFLRDRVLYGVRARYGSGYGLWQTAFVGIA